MQTLKSKLLDGFTYDETSQRLTLFMSNGHRREFVEVPSYVADDLLVAGSPGAYYFAIIKRRFKQVK